MFNTEEGQHSNINLRGVKIAKVVDNLDPKCQERVLVRVLGLHNVDNDIPINAVWAHHCAPMRTGAGDLPEKDDYIYVMFPDATDPMSILWLGFVRSSYQETTPVAPATVAEIVHSDVSAAENTIDQEEA